jgi:hypothetical protein
LAIATPKAASKRPRAINGAAVFAEEQKMVITERMAEPQDQDASGIPKKANLARYHTIKRELYNQLTDEERLAYETRATAKNEACKMPEKSKIYE